MYSNAIADDFKLSEWLVESEIKPPCSRLQESKKAFSLKPQCSDVIKMLGLAKISLFDQIICKDTANPFVMKYINTNVDVPQYWGVVLHSADCNLNFFPHFFLKIKEYLETFNFKYLQ